VVEKILSNIDPDVIIESIDNYIKNDRISYFVTDQYVFQYFALLKALIEIDGGNSEYGQTLGQKFYSWSAKYQAKEE